MKILVAEDEKEMQRILETALTMQKYEVDLASDGLEAYEKASAGSYDCMVFDVMMPKMTGIEALEKIRAVGDVTPVLMLTAKAEVDDRIGGLDAGADDYLTKPFALGELLARIRSLTRRSESFTPTKLSLGAVKLDTEQQEITSVNSIRLAGKETKLMEYFMLNPGKLLSSDQIFTKVWSDEPDTDPAVVWVYVSYLRQKLKAISADLEITGEEGGSYCLVQK